MDQQKKNDRKVLKETEERMRVFDFFFNIITPLGERMDRQKYGDERTGRQK